MKLWDKGYTLNKQVEDFTVGEDYLLDQKIVKYDCLASIAHVRMLEKIGLLKKEEVKKLVKELNNIITLHNKGEFKVLKEHEDCHTAIENHLTKKLGSLGEKIHTGRSRNDQVLTALRLYYKEELKNCKMLIKKFIKTLNVFIQEYGEIELPGYTHTRKAMPSSINLWGGAFMDSMKDNLKNIEFSLQLIDQSPLGTGAGYGIPMNIDREYVAKLLDFRKIQRNPLYTQNSRGKFESTILHTLTQIMFDINKIATDLILFSMPEFNYFELPKEFYTGSSIMPQKKNPDVLELLRAKYHIILSYEFQVKSLIGNLLSGYNRDLQLLKKSVIDGFEIVKKSLDIICLLFSHLEVNSKDCKKGLTTELYATHKVYDLVKKGVPFREAYREISDHYK
ncbi:MAG: argininosuccinate lyase [Thermoplasmata archaeon]|nr:MAG: argininosuccinate lyase [Thermoplasmata archaeon]